MSKELLFSYGTLQLKKVQLSSFGRVLVGHKDELPNFKLEQLEITDPEVLAKSKKHFHPIAIPSANEKDVVPGMLFEITPMELAQADAYEVVDYKRIKATFKSGKQGWVYIAAHT